MTEQLYLFEWSDGFKRGSDTPPSAITEGMTYRRNLAHPFWQEEDRRVRAEKLAAPLVRVPVKHARIPRHLKEVEITWDSDTAKFIKILINVQAHFNIETVSSKADDVEEKYLNITGETLLEMPGQYNIADNKWGTEATISYTPTAEIPERFSKLAEKPGKINNVGWWWALIRLGFRVSPGGVAHDTKAVRNNIPLQFTKIYDSISTV